MRHTVAIVVTAGILVGGTGPAFATSTPDALVCSPGQNGGHLVHGVCVLPGASQGQPYEGFILTSEGSGGTFTVTAGSPPPGLVVPRRYGAAGTIVAGTPTRTGRFTFTVKGVDQVGQPLGQTYRITVGPPPPLRVNATNGCSPGTVGVAYGQGFFAQGGVQPWVWSLRSGSLPPGLELTSPNGPDDRNSVLAGRPTAAGRFSLTMQVTDSRGAVAVAPPCTVTIGHG